MLKLVVPGAVQTINDSASNWLSKRQLCACVDLVNPNDCSCMVQGRAVVQSISALASLARLIRLQTAGRSYVESQLSLQAAAAPISPSAGI